jgi:hypothetical protein
MSARCPSWCVEHITGICQGELLSHVDVDGQIAQELLVRLALDVEAGEDDILYVTVASRCPGEKLWNGLHPDRPLSATGAAWLGQTLVKVAAQANASPGHTGAALFVPGEMNGPAWSGRRVECRDCEHCFDPDSSPHLDRCWSCAAHVDGMVTR